MNILEYAIKMELEGEKYYAEQAEIYKGTGISTVFNLLSEDEKMHAKVLQHKADKLDYNFKENETLSKAKSIFEKIESTDNAMEQIPVQLDVYRLSLENEKNSITLYKKYLSVKP